MEIANVGTSDNISWTCRLHKKVNDLSCVCAHSTKAVDKITAFRKHLKEKHLFAIQADGTMLAGVENAEEMYLNEMAKDYGFQVCYTHQSLSHRDIKHTAPSGEKVLCTEDTCKMSNYVKKVDSVKVSKVRTSGKQHGKFFVHHSFQEIAQLLGECGPGNKYGHRGGALILEKKCWLFLLSELKDIYTVGGNLTDILTKIEIFKRIVYEDVRHFQDKSEWKNVMMERMQLVSEDNWTKLQAWDILGAMREAYRRRLRRERPSMSKEEAITMEKRYRHKKATEFLQSKQVGKAFKMYTRTVVSTSNNIAQVKEKLQELFPAEESVGDIPVSEEMKRETAKRGKILEEVLEEVLTEDAFMKQVRKSKVKTVAGGDGWVLDRIKVLFTPDGGGLHQRLTPLFIFYMKLVYLEKLPLSYLKDVLGRSLVLVIEKDKKHVSLDGNQIRPVQPASGLLKIGETLLMKSQKQACQRLFGCLQYGIHQERGSEITAKRAQKAYDRGEFVLSMDEHSAFGKVRKSEVGKELSSDSVLRAVLECRATEPNTVVDWEGKVILQEHYKLPQGHSMSSARYGVTRLDVLREANTVITMDGEVTPQQGCYGFVDNYFVVAQDFLPAMKAFGVIEKRLFQVGSYLNAKDTVFLLPHLEDKHMDILRNKIDSSESILWENVIFHPQQVGYGRMLNERGAKIMGCPVGSIEYQRDFMDKKVEALINKVKVLEEIAVVDFQQFIIFLAQCCWQQPLAYWGRLIDPSIMEPVAIRYQEAMYGILEKVVGKLSPFHKKWLGKSSLDNGMNLFDIPASLMVGYIEAEIEFHAYLLNSGVKEENIVVDSKVLHQIERFIVRIGGWSMLKEEWRAERTFEAFYRVLLHLAVADNHVKLQEKLHAYVQKRDTELCEELLQLQSPIVQQIYHVSGEAGRCGSMPFRVLPCSRETTFSNPQMHIIFCKQFGLPLPGLQSGKILCPAKGCKTSLDEYGVHLLNCKGIATKKKSDQYNKQQLHEDMTLALYNLVSNKFSMVKRNPTGNAYRPMLIKPDGKQVYGRMDMKHEDNNGGKTVLWDVSVGNPLGVDTVRGVCVRGKGSETLNSIRTKKNTKYRKAIEEQLYDMELRVAPFTMYGQMGVELHNIIGEVADWVSTRGSDIDVRVLQKMYTRDMVCMLHKGVAKLLVARLDLIRRDGNELQRMGDDVYVIAGKVIEQASLFSVNSSNA